MKIIGTVVEFNPLHYGHVYAINEIKKQSGTDVLVAVMSGEFTMRGELSLFDKFTKTHQALKAGIDLVIELAFIKTVQNGSFFAEAAVLELAKAGVTEIWVGSEKNDPTIYEQLLKSWQEPENQQKIQDLLQQGYSYKSASASVLNLDPNDLLGFFYYQAIVKHHLSITLKTIKRVGSGYHDLKVDTFASSKAIRADLSLMDSCCPEFVEKENMRQMEQLFPLLKYEILNHSKEELSKISFVEEGIENVLKDVYLYSDFSNFSNALVSKRYTQSRIMRMLCSILFNIKKDDVIQTRKESPSYIRVLGYNSVGQQYLNQIKKIVSIKTNLKEGIDLETDINLKVTKILDSIYQSNLFALEQKGPIEEKEL